MMMTNISLSVQKKHRKLLRLILYNASKMKLNGKNQTYTGLITHLNNEFFDKLRGRVKCTQVQRSKHAKQFKYKCKMYKCCFKD